MSKYSTAAISKETSNELANLQLLLRNSGVKKSDRSYNSIIYTLVKKAKVSDFIKPTKEVATK